LLWTAKEALSKVLRCGFMIPFELLEIEMFEPNNDFAISYFKNFHQYQALSFPLANTLCSLVYPKKTELSLNTIHIQKIVSRWR
jgi:4'-phosphopantetheinyl transferase